MLSLSGDARATAFRRLALVLLVLGLLAAPASTVASAGAARAYLLSAGELSSLLGAFAGDVAVEPRPVEAQRWEAVARYAVALQAGSTFEVFISASILASPAEARQFFRDESMDMEAENEFTHAQAVTRREATGADEARELRLIFRGDASGRRVSDYARLLRFGRAVVMVEAVGSPEADDRGVLDNDRALSMVRIAELVAGKVLYYPPDGAGPLAGFESFTSEWGRHGWTLTIDPTGHGEARWRVYKWCADDPTPPCDQMIGNLIESGGWSNMVFYRVEGPTARGVVIGSGDPSALGLGPVSLSLEPYGMARLIQGETMLDLCGPDYARLAPDSLKATSPCGA